MVNPPATLRPPALASREAGYSMAALMVAVTILTVLTAAALPMWSQQMQREKEEELIFRGWQYAEAIRVFQQRHGRLPTRLQELIEVEPRSIRKLWEDPMTEDGRWGVVIQTGAGQQQQTPPGRPPQGGEGREGREGRSRPSGQGGGVCVGAESQQDGQGGRGGGRRAGGSSTGSPEVVGPIIGVCSRSDEESLKILFGEASYSAWRFTADKLGSGAVTGIGPEGARRGSGPVQPHTDAGGIPTLPRAQWIGRPFRPGIEPEAPASGGMPTPSTPGQDL